VSHCCAWLTERRLGEGGGGERPSPWQRPNTAFQTLKHAERRMMMPPPKPRSLKSNTLTKKQLQLSGSNMQMNIRLRSSSGSAPEASRLLAAKSEEFLNRKTLSDRPSTAGPATASTRFVSHLTSIGFHGTQPSLSTFFYRLDSDPIQLRIDSFRLVMASRWAELLTELFVSPRKRI